jgi:hypothetical protein
MIAEWITSLLALGVSIIFFLISFNFPSLSSDPAGPAIFPRIYCLLAGIPSLILIINMIYDRKSAESSPVSFFKTLICAWQGHKGDTENQYRKMTFVFILSFVYPWSISRIGFLIATAIYSFCIMKILKTKTINSAITSLILSCLLYIGFFYVLEAYLPPGTWIDAVF